MTTYAKVRTGTVVFDPALPASVPAGGLYMDLSNGNALTVKSTGGVHTPIGSSSSADIMVKYKRNSTGSTIAAYRRVALKLDGTICLADSDNATAMLDIGMSLDAITDGSYGRVLLNAANAAGALTGLGYLVGDHIFLSKTPGVLTNNISIFDPLVDTIMRVGYADCASNTASSAGTDLIMAIEVYSSPGGA